MATTCGRSLFETYSLMNDMTGDLDILPLCRVGPVEQHTAQALKNCFHGLLLVEQWSRNEICFRILSLSRRRVFFFVSFNPTLVGAVVCIGL